MPGVDNRVADNTPVAAVIIPHYNDGARLRRCLAALMPQMRPDVELVVVDNGSTEDLSDLRALFPDLNMVVEATKGAAAARNRGVAETTAAALFFLDCDCVPGPNWLDTALRIRHTGDVIGGQISVFDETPGPRSGAEAFEAVFAFDNRAYVEQRGFSVTANLLTRRDVFETTGPMIVGLSEDLDWCHRATKAGFSLIYADDLQVAHPSRSDWNALARKWRRLTAESHGVHQGAGRSALKWALRGLLMPASALVHSLKVLRHGDLANGTERLRGLSTLWRLRLTRMVWMLRQSLGAKL